MPQDNKSNVVLVRKLLVPRMYNNVADRYILDREPAELIPTVYLSVSLVFTNSNNVSKSTVTLMTQNKPVSLHTIYNYPLSPKHNEPSSG